MDDPRFKSTALTPEPGKPSIQPGEEWYIRGDQQGAFLDEKSDQIVWRPIGEAQKALGEGLKPLSRTEFDAAQLDAPGSALAAGMLRSASMGLSDVILGGIDPGLKDRLQGLKEVNPNASMIGEIAGAAIPNPASLAGNAVRGAKALATTPWLSRAAGAATEGLGFGAGQGVSRVSLSEKELSAGEAASTILREAIQGAAIGGASSLAWTGIKGLAGKGSELVKAKLGTPDDPRLQDIVSQTTQRLKPFQSDSNVAPLLAQADDQMKALLKAGKPINLTDDTFSQLDAQLKFVGKSVFDPTSQRTISPLEDLMALNQARASLQQARVSALEKGANAVKDLLGMGGNIGGLGYLVAGNPFGAVGLASGPVAEIGKRILTWGGKKIKEKLSQTAGNAAQNGIAGIAQEIAPYASQATRKAIVTRAAQQDPTEEIAALKNVDPNHIREDSLVGYQRVFGAMPDGDALAKSLSEFQANRIAFLQSKAATATDPVGKANYQRYSLAAADPGAMLERVAAGTATREDLETWRALSPSTYQQIAAVAKQLSPDDYISLTDSQRGIIDQLRGTQPLQIPQQQKKKTTIRQTTNRPSLSPMDRLQGDKLGG